MSKPNALIGNCAFPLLELDSSDMDELLSNEKTRGLTGLPIYYSRGRVWPAPGPGVEVVWVHNELG